MKYKFTRQDNKCRLAVFDNPYGDTAFELPLYYYKGYAAIEKNTGSCLEVSSSRNKLVTVSLGGSMREADLEIWYKGTFVQTFGNWLSALTLLYGMIYHRLYKHL